MQLAVAYYRVSRKKQKRSGLGLEAQKQNVSYFAEAAGFTVVLEFTEQESGENSKRPKLRAALRYCRKHKATLLIASVDRLTRNLLFACTLLESPTKFICVDKPWADEYIIQMDVAWAQKEVKWIKIRTKAALSAAKARGVKLGSNANNQHLKNKERSAEFARSMQPIIAAIRAEGITSVRAITRELSRRRIKTYRGRYTWDKTSVWKLLARLEH